MHSKTCRTCKNIFPETAEFFYASPSNREGLSKECKECKKKYNHNRHKKIQDAKPAEEKRRRLDPLSSSKICPKCEIEKSKEKEFWKSKSNSDGYASNCKDCSRKSTNKWRESELGRSKTKAQGIEWKLNNPDKVKENKKRFRENNPESIKKSIQKCWEENGDQYRITYWRHWLKKKYGLTEERYYEILENQEYRCAICKSFEKDSRKGRFCVDHCHDTNIIRGLLCFSCNVMLGNANDRIDLLREAIIYLKKFPKITSEKENDWLEELENEVQLMDSPKKTVRKK